MENFELISLVFHQDGFMTKPHREQLMFNFLKLSIDT
jgi:hypothetical protein